MEVIITLVLTILNVPPFVETSAVFLQNSSLAHVPHDIRADVTKLDLEDNNILHLTDCCFCMYPLLKRLTLERNGLQTVNEMAFANNSRLLRLYLGYNRRVSFPSFLYGAGNSVVFINLRVDAHAAPDTLTNLSFVNYPSLERIDLKHNRITSGVLNLSNLTSLTELIANGCGLDVFSWAICCTSIRALPTSPQPNQFIASTIYLWTHKTARITQLPSMQHLVALEELTLQLNNLTTLQDLYDLSLTSVNLNRNSLMCDKLLCWLRMWCFVKPILAEVNSSFGNMRVPGTPPGVSLHGTTPCGYGVLQWYCIDLHQCCTGKSSSSGSSSSIR